MTNPPATLVDLDPILVGYTIVVPLLLAATLSAIVFFPHNAMAAAAGRPQRPLFHFAALATVWLLSSLVLLPPLLNHGGGPINLYKFDAAAIKLVGVAAKWIAPTYLCMTVIAVVFRRKAPRESATTAPTS
jgi:hypothetical protein